MKWLSRTAMVFPLHYRLCTNEKMFLKTLKHIKLKKEHWPAKGTWTKSDEHAKVWYFENAESSKEMAIICMPIAGDHSLSQMHALLVHEAVHMWQRAKIIIGEDSPSSEFEAYTLQNICQELFVELKRQMKKGKKK